MILVGIDEVGRGPIAGPVTVGVCASFVSKATLRRIFKGAKESKQLTASQREEWYVLIKNAQKAGHIRYAVTHISHKIIDSKGLSFAICKALADSLDKLALEVQFDEVSILLDGGLKAPVEYVKQKTIIKGDAKELIIALASIAAKVERDQLMLKLATKHPNYGLEVHKGYGTKGHYEALKKHGVSPIHRRLFLRKYLSRSGK